MVSSFDLPSKVNSEERPFLKPGVISDHPRRPHQHQQKQGQGKNNDAPHVGRDSHSHSVSPHLLQTGPSIDFFIARLPPFSFVQIRASHGFLPSATHAVSCPRFRAGWQILPVFPGCHLAGRIPHPAPCFFGVPYLQMNMEISHFADRSILPGADSPPPNLRDAGIEPASCGPKPHALPLG